jgi:hypothetical protein
MGKREWTGMYCTGERHQMACLSWFQPVVPEAWGLPVAADVQEDVDTGRETAIRALFILPSGKLMEAFRSRVTNRNIVTLRPASPNIIKGAAAQYAIAKATGSDQ